MESEGSWEVPFYLKSGGVRWFFSGYGTPDLLVVIQKSTALLRTGDPALNPPQSNISSGEPPQYSSDATDQGLFSNRWYLHVLKAASVIEM